MFSRCENVYAIFMHKFVHVHSDLRQTIISLLQVYLVKVCQEPLENLAAKVRITYPI